MDFEQTTGMRAATVLAAFFGSALSLSYAKEMTRTQAAVSVCAGVFVAVYGAPVVLHVLPAPWGDISERGAAFFMGLFAMRGVPAVLGAIDNLRNLKTPWNKD